MMVNRNWNPIREKTVRLLDLRDVYVHSVRDLRMGRKTVRELGARFTDIERNYRQFKQSRMPSNFFRMQLFRMALYTRMSRFIQARNQLRQASDQVRNLQRGRRGTRTRMAAREARVREQMEAFFRHAEEIVMIKIEDVSAIRYMKLFGEELEFRFGTSARGSVRQYITREMFKLSGRRMHFEPGQRYVLTSDGRFHLREELIEELL